MRFGCTTHSIANLFFFWRERQTKVWILETVFKAMTQFPLLKLSLPHQCYTWIFAAFLLFKTFKKVVRHFCTSSSSRVFLDFFNNSQQCDTLLAIRYTYLTSLYRDISIFRHTVTPLDCCDITTLLSIIFKTNVKISCALGAVYICCVTYALMALVPL